MKGAIGLVVHLRRKFNAELFGGVTAQHAREQGFVNPSARERFDRLDSAGGIVMWMARSPNYLFSEVVWQFLNLALFGIETEHHMTFFPQLLGIGADRIVMEQRDRAGRGLHLLEHFFHP